MSCGVGCRCGLDPSLLWLWYRPAAIAPIHPLTWELPYAAGVALKTKTKTKTKRVAPGPENTTGAVDRNSFLRRIRMKVAGQGDNRIQHL